jgi:hypothetical protein
MTLEKYGADGMIWLRQMGGVASLSCVRFAPGRANPLRGFESMVTH